MAPETVGFEDPSQQGVQPVEPWQDPEKKGIVSCRVKDEKKKKNSFVDIDGLPVNDSFGSRCTSSRLPYSRNIRNDVLYRTSFEHPTG